MGKRFANISRSENFIVHAEESDWPLKNSFQFIVRGRAYKAYPKKFFFSDRTLE